ncbi:bifunctional diaminohydroxyphosphoribosylaminopyrimidine deaminase/5-amino-6-(5-phosphoribosylamino)uracil reductase RibD [Alkaliphilus sp. B6464]|uniref:bifunctional diaminohydroxyphosphoribosylaminopyrimidine deaminase/5-amino-6-(5-phosphoribosylamino)uracil reductase RibD n=1 Tax=Alkaliphilus sp. B6464 TaxID=2731219 RepID=UPI001BA608B5|nr:bifunctional diaminohydroxyphosphoribosylaminopyrimidine deaminase/5-amino-6-(5-phosphoribosylamino)uracil reductase RibD [Alkaliphilus sp. B6464]QUH19460.1 bifunctional diaminohydroxyphosphoribosylaminopyrimidine deaminase/5-amino-6-(5-phosphoribosylamino)uracil reductase RibD [Alkaliphilus sp. B6464]
MDYLYMARALDLAKLGIGYTSPNPLVGAVIVKDGRIIGEGYHKKYGDAHAEVNAFNNTKEDVTGATMYVTLEPCSYFGKTPPCVNTIIKKGIKKVVVAMEDPNPLVAGKGISILREHGIEVAIGVLEDKAKKLNEVFIKFITTGRPFCVLKTAMTLDGKIASYTGDSRWVTNEESRRYVHELRHRFTSIMVGIGTVLADDPLLTTRLDSIDKKNPIRIVVDTRGNIPLDANVLQCDNNTKTIIATTEATNREKLKYIEELGADFIIVPLKNNKVDLSYLMRSLGERKIDSVLLEGGSTLNYTALAEGIVDKVISFIGPKIIGGSSSKSPVGGKGIPYMKDAIFLKNIDVFRFKDDVMIEAYIRKEV